MRGCDIDTIANATNVAAECWEGVGREGGRRGGVPQWEAGHVESGRRGTPAVRIMGSLSKSQVGSPCWQYCSAPLAAAHWSPCGTPSRWSRYAGASGPSRDHCSSATANASWAASLAPWKSSTSRMTVAPRAQTLRGRNSRPANIPSGL